MDSTSQNLQDSFPDFLNVLKHKISHSFHTRDRLDRISIQRGLPPFMMREIMSVNPLSVCIPTEYGGRGDKPSEVLAVLEAASYESLALSLTFGINMALFLQPLSKYASEESRVKVLGDFLQNKKMGGLMITEPDHGSDALHMQTFHTQNNGYYQLKGMKHWAGLTGWADYWLLTARQKSASGHLQRDIDFFICDVNGPDQTIVVEEFFNNLGLYMIPYGRNRIDVRIPAVQRLIPTTSGVNMMLDILHHSRIMMPGIAMGFIKRILDEAVTHCRNRTSGGKSHLTYDQVQFRLARIQACYTICSAMCAYGSQNAHTQNDLVQYGLEANSIKSLVTDLMQECAQSLLQLVGAKGYKLDHISGRATVDSRPFQIFEGSNDILNVQITENLLKGMKNGKEKNFYRFLKSHSSFSRAAESMKVLINVDLDSQLSQRKQYTLGRVIADVFALDLVIILGEKGFRHDLIEAATTFLQMEVSQLMNGFRFGNDFSLVEDYQDRSYWRDF
ncbi:MAG: acyl-CoA dehydrogenase family protein [Bacteroidota bacterium]